MIEKEDAKRCIHCMQCTKNCLFLKKYQMDLLKFSETPSLAFSCFLCGKCKAVCPKDIDGALISLQMRCEAVEKTGGKIEDKAYRGLIWEKNSYKFSNYQKGKKKSVLFPGCNFPSFFPKTMKIIEELMKDKEIGVVYDCCRKPIYELGMVEESTKAIKKMEEKLKEQKVERLIMLCPNCYHFLKDKIDIPIVTIYEILREMGIGKPIEREEIPIYYPCPDREGREIFKEILPFLSGEVKEDFQDLQCCGLGGCAALKEQELAVQMARSPIEKEKEMYTYCASCISNFRRKGFAQSYHVLPLIMGVDEEIPSGILPLWNRAKHKLI